MKDLHTHILFNIDDGSNSIEESITILKKMEHLGITDVMLTPHYIENSKYNCNNKEKKELLDTLKKRAKEENISINLYLGNEVFFTESFIELIEKKEISTLNGSKYLLMEFPMGPVYNSTSLVISEVISKGYNPILAHPERYPRFQEHPQIAEEYLRMGVHLQGNFTSLFGKYGKKSEKTLIYLLKKKQISFLGSDVHHDPKFNIKKLEKKLLKITRDKKYVEDLLNNNFDKVINNEEIEIIR